MERLSQRQVVSQAAVDHLHTTTTPRFAVVARSTLKHLEAELTAADIQVYMITTSRDAVMERL